MGVSCASHADTMPLMLAISLFAIFIYWFVQYRELPYAKPPTNRPRLPPAVPPPRIRIDPMIQCHPQNPQVSNPYQSQMPQYQYVPMVQAAPMKENPPAGPPAITSPQPTAASVMPSPAPRNLERIGQTPHVLLPPEEHAAFGAASGAGMAPKMKRINTGYVFNPPPDDDDDDEDEYPDQDEDDYQEEDAEDKETQYEDVQATPVDKHIEPDPSDNWEADSFDSGELSAHMPTTLPPQPMPPRQPTPHPAETISGIKMSSSVNPKEIFSRLSTMEPFESELAGQQNLNPSTSETRGVKFNQEVRKGYYDDSDDDSDEFASR